MVVKKHITAKKNKQPSGVKGQYSVARVKTMKDWQWAEAKKAIKIEEGNQRKILHNSCNRHATVFCD